MKTKGSIAARPDPFPEPRQALLATQEVAIRVRKLLRARRRQLMARGTSWSGHVDDTVRDAELIERLASYGQSLSAAEASDLAGRLELLVQELTQRVLGFLASQGGV